MARTHPTPGPSRRGFLKAGAAAAAGLAWAGGAFADRRVAGDKRLIWLNLVGGPSQLDTFDPKPDAPAEVRGPFGTIPTRTPGVRFSELLPNLAALSDCFALVRTLHHAEAPIHETGQQLVQTGRLARDGETPHVGVVLGMRADSAGDLPPFVVLPEALGSTGVNVSQGQGAGHLGADYGPAYLDDLPCHLPARAVSLEPKAVKERYGQYPFGWQCLMARRLVEAGVRCVTVNMFTTVFDGLSWDCHADGTALPTTLADYRDTICPQFDGTVSALLNDLEERGLLATTLVVATGAFGRTPKLNPRGGRDHWPGVWSALLAGCGVRGGCVVGSSDRHGGEPADRPVTPAEFVATVYHALGVGPVSWVEAAPLHEVF
jgi:uncharacterized protein (DUF1501 family)